jgi:integrase
VLVRPLGGEKGPRRQIQLGSAPSLWRLARGRFCGRRFQRRPTTDITAAWERLRSTAAVKCRLHDLRHTFATRLAENGVPESTMVALLGHMSRAMLERYSHIRMAATATR